MEKYTVKLTKEERESLLSLTKTGKHAASKILHARILLASDEGEYYKERLSLNPFLRKSNTLDGSSLDLTKQRKLTWGF